MQGSLPAPGKGSVFDSKSDAETWKMFKEGDDGAFVFIYRGYIQSLYHLGMQFTASEALVKDCLQDFFMELREKKNRLGYTDNIKLYLFKSFRRRIIAYKKKESRFISTDHFRDTFAIEFATDEKIINAQFSSDQLNQLKAAIERLSPKYREIVYFYFYQNLSYQEIAGILNYDHVSSARRAVYRVLKKLRKFMPMLTWLAGKSIAIMQLDG